MIRSSAGGKPVQAAEPNPPQSPARILGLLVSSTACADQLLDIAAGACARDIELRVHLIGAGVLLSRTSGFARLRGSVSISVCLESARSYGLENVLGALDPPVLLPCRLLADLLLDCDRCLIL